MAGLQIGCLPAIGGGNRLLYRHPIDGGCAGCVIRERRGTITFLCIRRSNIGQQSHVDFPFIMLVCSVYKFYLVVVS